MSLLAGLSPSLRLRASARRSAARQAAVWEPSRSVQSDVVVGVRMRGGGGGIFGGRGSFRVRRRWRSVIGGRGRSGVRGGSEADDEVDVHRYEYGYDGWAFQRERRSVRTSSGDRRDEEAGTGTEAARDEETAAEAAAEAAEEAAGDVAGEGDREQGDGVQERDEGERTGLRWVGRRGRFVRVVERAEPRRSIGGSSVVSGMGEMGMTGIGIRMGIGTGGEGRSVMHYHHHYHYHLYPHREGRMSDVGEGRGGPERVLGVYGYSAGEGVSGGETVVIGGRDGEVDPGAGVWRGWPDRRQRVSTAEGGGSSRRRRLRRMANWVVQWRRRGRRRRRRWGGGSDDGESLGLSYEELLELEERNVKRGLSKDEFDALEVVAWEKLQAEQAASASASASGDGDGDDENDAQSQPRLYRQGSACRICLDTVRPADRLIRLKCKHWYHKSCIETWFTTNRTCPVCRTEVEKIQPATTSKVAC